MAINIHNLRVSNMTVGPVPPSGLPIISNGLLYYYDMRPGGSYSGTGSTLTDLSGNGVDAQLNSGYFTPNYVSSGDASYLDYTVNGSGPDNNSTGGLAVIPNSVDLNYLRGTPFNFSMSIWYNTNDRSRDQSFGGVDVPDLYYGYYGYRQSYSNTWFNYRAYSNDDYLFFSAYQNMTSNTSYYSNRVTDTWVNFAITFDTSTLRMYVNGTLDRSYGVSNSGQHKWGFYRGTGGYLYDNNGSNLRISAFGIRGGGWGDINSNSGSFTAKLNSTAFYTRTLSDAEILSNYEAILPRFS